MKPEIWKPIKGFEGIYEVSTRGRVRSIDRDEKMKNNTSRPRKGRILVLCLKRNGYLSAHLSKNGISYSILVHKLVAVAFIPNPNNLPCINHKDLNKLNNCVENLEWCTYQYNNTYDNARVKAAIKRCSPVEQYTLDGEFVAKYRSAGYAAKVLGMSAGNLCSHLKGRQKSFAGYIWKRCK